MLNSGVLGSSLFSAPLPLRPSGRGERATLARLESRLFSYRRASVFPFFFSLLVLLGRAETTADKGRCRINLAERLVPLLSSHRLRGAIIKKKNTILKKKWNFLSVLTTVELLSENVVEIQLNHFGLLTSRGRYSVSLQSFVAVIV